MPAGIPSPAVVRPHGLDIPAAQEVVVSVKNTQLIPESTQTDDAPLALASPSPMVHPPLPPNVASPRYEQARYEQDRYSTRSRSRTVPERMLQPIKQSAILFPDTPRSPVSSYPSRIASPSRASPRRDPGAASPQEKELRPSLGSSSQYGVSVPSSASTVQGSDIASTREKSPPTAGVSKLRVSFATKDFDIDDDERDSREGSGTRESRVSI